MKVYKNALVTGGAQRIGASIAEFLAENGIDVAIQYNRSEKKMNIIKKKVTDQGVKFNAFKCDFSKDCNFDIFFEKIRKKHGNIDILINNASTFEFDTIKKTNQSIFDKHINVNLKAPISKGSRVTRAFFISRGELPQIKARIINNDQASMFLFIMRPSSHLLN